MWPLSTPLTSRLTVVPLIVELATVKTIFRSLLPDATSFPLDLVTLVSVLSGCCSPSCVWAVWGAGASSASIGGTFARKENDWWGLGRESAPRLELNLRCVLLYIRYFKQIFSFDLTFTFAASVTGLSPKSDDKVQSHNGGLVLRQPLSQPPCAINAMNISTVNVTDLPRRV